MRLAAVAAVVLSTATFIGWQVAQSPIHVASRVDPEVTIECTPSTGVDEAACRAWGDGILAAGPPSTTFEMQDLARLKLGRSLLGLGAGCEAVYFIARYPESPVWTDDAECRRAR